MTIFRSTLIAFLFMFGLAACSTDDLQGTVVGKEVEPGYNNTTFMPTYSTTCTGSPPVCTQSQTGVIPITSYVPTCYKIYVEGTTSGDSCIDKGKWESLSEGDDYVGVDVKPEDLKEQK